MSSSNITIFSSSAEFISVHLLLWSRSHPSEINGESTVDQKRISMSEPNSAQFAHVPALNNS